MKKLWWRFLDRFFPRYLIGVDPAYLGEPECTVVMKRLRDDTVEIISVSFPNQGGQS